MAAQIPMRPAARDLRCPSTAAVSMMSENPRDPDEPGEYETVARLGRRHTYRGLDGRQLAEHDEDLPDWKPAPLRWPFLTVLTAVLFALMAATIYAVQTLPTADSRGALWLAESAAESNSTTALADATWSADGLSRRAPLVETASVVEASSTKTSGGAQTSPISANSNQGNTPQAPAQGEADRQREFTERNKQLNEQNRLEAERKNNPTSTIQNQQNNQNNSQPPGKSEADRQKEANERNQQLDQQNRQESDRKNGAENPGNTTTETRPQPEGKSEWDKQKEADERNNKQLDEQNREESDRKNRPGQSPSPTPTPTPTPIPSPKPAPKPGHEPGNQGPTSTSTDDKINIVPTKTGATSISTSTTTTTSTTETASTQTPSHGFPGEGNSGGGKLGDFCSDRRPCAEGACKINKCTEGSNNGGGGNVGDVCNGRRPCNNHGAICKDNKCVSNKTTNSSPSTSTENPSGEAAIGDSCLFRPCVEGGKCENGQCVADKPTSGPPQTATTTRMPENGGGGPRIGEKCGMWPNGPNCTEGKCVNGVCVDDKPSNNPPTNQPPDNGGVKLEQPCGISAPWNGPKNCVQGTCKPVGLGWKCVQESSPGPQPQPQPQPQLPTGPKLGDRCGESVVLLPLWPKDCSEGQCQRSSLGFWTCEKEDQHRPPESTPPNGGGDGDGLVKLNEKCGGIGYTGPARCEKGTCKFIGPYHSQCVEEVPVIGPGSGVVLFPKLHEKCGGIGYIGPTLCAQGTCKVINPYLSQCADGSTVSQPGNGGNEPTPESGSNPVKLVQLFGQCGGHGYIGGPNACLLGSCVKKDESWSECRFDNPWSKKTDEPPTTREPQTQTTRESQLPWIGGLGPGQEDDTKAGVKPTQTRPEPGRNPIQNGQNPPEMTRPPFISNTDRPESPKVDGPKEDLKDEDALPPGRAPKPDRTTSQLIRPSPHVKPTKLTWIEVETIVKTDSKGDRTTWTGAPTPRVGIFTLTSTDSQGRPTIVTVTTTLPVITSTLTDSNGVPTATITQYAAIPTSVVQASSAEPVEAMSRLSRSQHFAAFFLPLLLSVGLLAAARMVETTARQLQPFHRMTHPYGAPAVESFCQRVGLVETIPTALKSLKIPGGILRDPPVLLLSKLLLLFSAILVPLAPEALALNMSENCRPEIGYEGCTASVSILPVPAWAAAGVIATMVLLALLLVVSLQRWTTGVASNPWSNAGMASMCANPEIRSILLSLPNGLGFRPSVPDKRPPRESTTTSRVLTHEQLVNAAGDRTFRLGMFPTEGGNNSSSLRENASTDYGIVLCNMGAEGNSLTAGSIVNADGIGIAISTPMAGTTAMTIASEGAEEFEYSDDDEDEDEDDLGPADDRAPQGAGKFVPLQRQEEHHLPFMMLTYTPRLVFVGFACALLVVIMYHQNSSGDGGFERFMNQEGFGARLLFTTVGVAIAFFWASFFTNVSLMSPYLMLSMAPQRAERSILISPSSNPFSGLSRAIRNHHFFLAVISATAILAEAMPILLHNLPSRGDLIASKHSTLYQACTWASVGIICVMLAVITSSFFVSWPHMPSDPSSPAGAMFYVCDSPGMAWALEGAALLAERERDSSVRALGMTYEFGAMEGMSGRRRVGVDADETSGAALFEQPDGAAV